MVHAFVLILVYSESYSTSLPRRVPSSHRVIGFTRGRFAVVVGRRSVVGLVVVAVVAVGLGVGRGRSHAVGVSGVRIVRVVRVEGRQAVRMRGVGGHTVTENKRSCS